MMESKILNNIESFSKIKIDYINLIEKDKNITPFYTHRWLINWWKAFENEYDIKMFCLFEGNEIVFAIPLMFGEETIGKIKFRKASFLGGNWGIFDVPWSEKAVGWDEAFWSWLFSKEAPSWSILQFCPLNQFSTFGEAMIRSLKERKIAHIVMDKPILYMPLPKTWEEFIAKKSKNFRRNIKRKEAALVESGSFNIQCITNPGIIELRDTVFKVCKRSWQGLKGEAVGATKNGQTFYELIAESKGEFDVELTIINFGEQCVAYLLGLTKNEVYHAFDTGFDQAYEAFSPGFLTHIFALRELFGKGFIEFNFGYNHSYKDRFEPLNYSSKEIIIFRNKLIYIYCKLLDRIKPLVEGWSR